MAPRNRRMHIGVTVLTSEESTLKTAPSRGRSHATTAASGTLGGADERDRVPRHSTDAVLERAQEPKGAGCADRVAQHAQATEPRGSDAPFLPDFRWRAIATVASIGAVTGSERREPAR